ncbi:glycoside hydrolase family protein [Francisella philomiragia]|uniref:hypothetical protein n=1 Tax=Francisella philomiragia TaxID=28110 RepID=UPI0019040C6F|nr:hypothetical protein [Francisella philomiragia]MBK2267746.1 hypothetical protein [Francisella philomiragia]MBK2279156.1 hypothetical protein [Francisella philomiragia]MBK2287055.1 hypothetical protein [Francisella philomiragia]MBK2288988.1 hypothetical protein [Francisella philomiragia]MBK2290706.1 hypothetical protein [Francisella philomiragia]
MKWEKHGLIFAPITSFDWNRKGYASVPTVYKLDDNSIRIYYTARDFYNRTNVSFIECEADNPKNILYVHDKPVLSAGSLGMFDDCGAMVSHVIDVGNEVWMYYIGWNVRNTVAYHNSIGLAISNDGGVTFKKFSEGPLFDRTYKEPYFSAAPYVLREDGIWKMWYLSNTKWIEYKDKSEPFYHIKYAESDNGIDWKREGKVAIDYKDENECGIVRACVIKDNDIYKMWYAHRNIQNYRIDKNSSYRIGYAESNNGIDWIRKDSDVGIDVSESDWDSEMIEYPFVYDHNGQRYMIYNGNTFGKTGFGYAELGV